ncbi:MAG: hypothetical protein QOG13_319 [Sphingomonadales bacterium]|jgi:hypothetical protein|nr:hypothetical protein [Sphingomonadales bacterium]
MTELPPLVAGLADPAAPGSDCGCCEGIAIATPRPAENRPGLPAIAYRAGRFADFRRSQLARLSADEHPALASLRSRENDDFTIALIDAWSCVCDVLTFYQERIANEAWLGTATERLSVVELGRLIGYQPRPGVAATTALVFLMDEPPGAEASVAAVAIPPGTRVQSIPGPDETAQTFETVAAIEARVAWNALAPRQTRLVLPASGDSGAWLAGTGTDLKVGDAVLVLGQDRIANKGSTRWDFRKLTMVEADSDADRTRVEWTPPLAAIEPPGTLAGQQLFALRTRASLFGWNAPHPAVLADTTLAHYPNQLATKDWSFTVDDVNAQIDLDAIYPGFVAGGWVAATRPDGAVQAYRIVAATDAGRADYAMSGRTTRLTLDTNYLFHTLTLVPAYRQVSVYGNSEGLALAETPLAEPVQGETIELAGLVDGLEEGHQLVVRGRRAQVVAVADGLSLGAPGDPPRTMTLAAGERLTLLAAPAPLPGWPVLVWHLRAASGFEGFAFAPAAAFAATAADSSAELVAEAMVLAEADLVDQSHGRLRFAGPLAAIFDRASTLVHGNVAAATHGETTHEILGDGDAGRPFLSFALKQSPLTHVSAANETGAASTLAVRVDDILWHEVPSLYGRGPEERVFESRTNDDGTTIVQFGDGVSGARPPTGRNNLVAVYRKGIGTAGSVAADALSMALDRPLGLDEVFNPVPASGGQDAETLASARVNAPIGTLTLGRVVSLLNYEQFAMSFAGIAKARADWVWDGDGRRIVVTVAGPGGAALDNVAGGVLDSLTRALGNLGDPLVRLTVMGFRPAYFRLDGKLAVLPDYDPEIVLAAVEAALRDAYGFERRGFSRLVALSEILATIHEVAGVRAVDLDRLYRTSGSGSAPILHARLLASPVSLAPDDSLLAAEILTLHSGPLGLVVMP